MDPFLLLEVAPDAGDDEIKRRYLALVRTYSPERDPEKFQAVRMAYEAIRDRRSRLRSRLLARNGAGALARLKLALLECAGESTGSGRASRDTVAAVLIEGISGGVPNSASSSDS